MGKFNEHESVISSLDELHNGYKRGDLHIHSTYSDGMKNPADLIDEARKKNLNAIAITDHDNIRGSQVARNIAVRNNTEIEIIPGTEISTTDGHLLALYIDDNIPSGMSVEKTIENIHKQQGLSVVTHPGIPYVKSISLEKIEQVISSHDEGILIDGIELINYSASQMYVKLLFRKSNNNVINYYRGSNECQKYCAPLANSDSHTGSLGCVYTCYDSPTMKEAIQNKKTSAHIVKPNVLRDTRETLIYTGNVFRQRMR
jgi:predicted metal-dependent phosphoesterase TrpH